MSAKGCNGGNLFRRLYKKWLQIIDIHAWKIKIINKLFFILYKLIKTSVSIPVLVLLIDHDLLLPQTTCTNS